jgi:hypothetical protein
MSNIYKNKRSISTDVFNKETCDKILEYLNLKKITQDEKLDRLEKKMSEDQFLQLMEEIYDINTHKYIGGSSTQVMERYMRQFARPFKLKTRKLDTKKHGIRSSRKTIKHYGVFFNDGHLYHWLPKSVKYGENEYNKEVASYYPWNDLKDNVYFTLVTDKEIEDFVKRWEETFVYSHKNRSSELFSYALTYFLI